MSSLWSTLGDTIEYFGHLSLQMNGSFALMACSDFDSLVFVNSGLFLFTSFLFKVFQYTWKNTGVIAYQNCQPKHDLPKLAVWF